MDDNKNPPENQSAPTPIFQSVPQPTQTPPPNLTPEEVAPEVLTPEQAYSEAPPSAIPPSDAPPVFEEKHTRIFIIAGAVVFFLVVFFLILKLLFGGKTTTGPVKLTYWGLWEDKAVMQPLIDQYQKKNPNVTIEYTKLVPEQYREKLLARAKNGDGPDIFRYHNTWLPEITEVVSKLPSSVMSNDEFEKTFYPIQSKDLKIGNYYYGIPLEIDGLVLIYNDKLLKNVGVAKPPANIDELTSVVPKLTVKGQNDELLTAAIALGTANNVEHFSDIFGLMLLANGADLKKLNTQEAAGTLESYRLFADKGFWNERMPNSVTAFIQEKVAMIIAPSWEIITIKTQNPDLAVKVAPIPLNLPGNKPISLTNYWVEGVSAYSKNQVEAWKFLKFLSEKEQMQQLYELESKTRPFGEPYSRRDLAPALAKHEFLGVVINGANELNSMPVVWRTYDNGLNDNIIKYIENAINQVAQGTAADSALATARTGIDQILQQYKIQ